MGFNNIQMHASFVKPICFFYLIQAFVPIQNDRYNQWSSCFSLKSIGCCFVNTSVYTWIIRDIRGLNATIKASSPGVRPRARIQQRFMQQSYFRKLGLSSHTNLGSEDSLHVCVLVSMYASLYVCMYVCMYLCMYACMHVSMCSYRAIVVRGVCAQSSFCTLAFVVPPMPLVVWIYLNLILCS